jgi:histidyl-tRNA synthetase
MPEPINSFEPPRGMRDFYPEEMALREHIFQAWRTSARQSGFAAYDACVVESLALLKRKAGEEIVEQIYTFTDKSGRELALRPEMTPTLARMVLARQGSLTFPLKWTTIAQCFRYERTTRGRKREHYQWNLDIIGENSMGAEIEVIACAVNALALLGLHASDVYIHFSSRALLSDLLVKFGIAPPHHTATFLALDKRGKIPDEEIAKLLEAEGLDEAARATVFNLLRVSTFEEAGAILGADTPSYEAVKTFLNLADAYGIRDILKFDISVIRGLAYYTGIVFEAFDAARQFRAIFGGGRYDRLLQDLGGKPASCVGLGFGDVVIAELLAAQNKTGAIQAAADMAIGFMDEAQRMAAIRLAVRLRKSGKTVDVALAPEKPKHFFGRAGKGGFKDAAYLGPDDVARNKVRIKNLAAFTEQEMDLPQ